MLHLLWTRILLCLWSNFSAILLQVFSVESSAFYMPKIFIVQFSLSLIYRFKGLKYLSNLTL